MSSELKSGTAGFVLGIAIAGAAAAAAQPAQHEHQVAPPAQSAPAHGMDQMHRMMADPAKHKQMMDQMAQCRDMMSMMMEHMRHEGMKKDHPAPDQ